MILKSETDWGTDIVVPQLDPADDRQVLLTLLSEGEQTSTQRLPVGEWPALEAQFLQRGYLPTSDTPELAVAIDRSTRCVRIAGGDPTVLDNPDDSTDDEPIEPLVIQADDLLIDGGYMRMSDWWAGPNDMLLARVVPNPRSDIPTEIRYIVRAQLAVAAQHLRDWLTEHGQGDQAIADRLRLAVDPTGTGVGERVHVVVSHGYPTKFYAGLVTFHAALRAAEEGDARKVAELAGAVPGHLH